MNANDLTRKQSAYVERDCTITGPDGKVFESGGAVVTDDFIVAYPAVGGDLKDWHGNVLGTWRETARWRVRSYMGTHMLQIHATVDGKHYTGRGFGEGMIFKGKRTKGK